MIGGVFTMMDISMSALRAERAKMNVHANNLANIQTTRDADGAPNPYCRRRIFFKAGAPDMTGSSALGVEVDKIDEDWTTEFPKKYEPNHPDADAQGYVRYPNVNVVEEMVNMMVSQRAYQANLTAFETARQLFQGALQLIV